MPDYILLMHKLPDAQDTAQAWDAYLETLASRGVLRGGSVIGVGMCVRREGVAPPVTAHIDGFIRIEAQDLDHARELVAGNPVYEAGGTIEIRELPRSV